MKAYFRPCLPVGKPVTRRPLHGFGRAVPESGSSVVLAFAQDKAVLAIHRREVGLLVPVRQCPERVAFAGCVLPTGPYPVHGFPMR
jgi:hypothetical protein